MNNMRVSGICKFSPSYLPDIAIDNILKYLPLRDAVRTSILSREWRYKWTSVPKLEFDYSFHKRSLKNNKLETIVSIILSVHEGPIVEFILSVNDFSNCPEINHWILLLPNNNVEKFSLRISPENFHEMPSHFFSFVKRRILNLFHCVVRPPPVFQGFSKLVKLRLERVILEPETFGIFISNCPFLESLGLWGCTDFNALELDTPKLKYFGFHGSFVSMFFKRAPLLAHLSISLAPSNLSVDQNAECLCSNLIKFFRPLLAIQKLRLEFRIMEFLIVGGIPKVLPYSLSHLERLDIGLPSFSDIEDISCALCLLKSSPNLSCLKITAISKTTSEPVNELLRAQTTKDFCLSHLQKVKMQNFSGEETELEFVKLVLASAMVLETMEIWSVCDSASSEGYLILKELARFRRVSPKAEITYEDPK